MGAQHTPGPWSVDRLGVICGGDPIQKARGVVRAQVAMATGGEGISHEEKRANEHLIAAAPSLLDAAKAFVEPYVEVTDAQLRWAAQEGLARTGRGHVAINITPGVASAVLTFRAAIAKAVQP